MENWLHNEMEQDARRIEVWMPTMTNDTEVKEFRGKVRKFLSQNTITQKELAGKVGVSVAQLNQFLQGKYRGDCETLVKKLVDFINRYERRRRTQTGGEYVDTTVAKAIQSVIKNTESLSLPQEGRISAIIGDAGTGKTACLQAYATSHSNTVYVKLYTRMSSKSLFSRIADAMGLDGAATLKRMMDEIAAHLRKRELTVLLDEASGLDVTRLDLLRQIISESGAPMILAGNSHILKTIHAAGRHGYEAMDQFRSRMLTVLNLDEAAGADGGGVYTAADIRKLYEYGGIKLSSDGADTLKRICRAPQTGRLRTCSIIIGCIHNSREVRAGKITTIDKPLILSAIKLLGLPIQDRLPMVLAQAIDEEPAAAAKTG
ncbi:MAG: AAA family ATPase [Planctomycetota bacterium]|nr:AAA family ATPase [Planctomycetota bacterium]